MLITIEHYFLLFLAYSFLGWVFESGMITIRERRFVNRGSLIGPILPIYGFGALLVTFLLSKYASDPLALFLLAMFVCGTLEYLTSLVMEKLFHARWWDYSDKPFNINGRICLSTLLLFGVASLVGLLFINPALFDFFAVIPDTLRHVLCVIFLIGFLLDVIISAVVLTAVRQAGTIANAKSGHRDATEEITREVHRILHSRSWLHRRLLRAFPHLRHIHKSKN